MLTVLCAGDGAHSLWNHVKSRHVNGVLCFFFVILEESALSANVEK